MEKHDLLRRAEDLLARSRRSSNLTHTGFLSPAEQFALEGWAARTPGCRMLLHGGGEDCERRAAFFLPDWMDEESFDPAEYLSALRLTAFFGEPGHRDYLGAILAMGIGREWLGDIRIDGSTAWVFCMPSVLRHLLSLDQVGRVSVRAEELPLDRVPRPERKVEERSFSVMSLRLDAVAAGMFHLSRTEAARLIEAGALSLNYEICLKTDQSVRAGDVISLRGAGKGKISGTGGVSRKGRLFVYTEICT